MMLRRALRTAVYVVLGLGGLWLMMPFLLNTLLYFPSRHFYLEPAALGLQPANVTFVKTEIDPRGRLSFNGCKNRRQRHLVRGIFGPRAG